MYTLGENWEKINRIWYEGIQKNPDDQLLKDIEAVLTKHAKKYIEKYGINYTITSGTINTRDLRR